MCLETKTCPVLDNRLSQTTLTANAWSTACGVSGPRHNTPADSAEPGKLFWFLKSRCSDFLLYSNPGSHHDLSWQDALPFPRKTARLVQPHRNSEALSNQWVVLKEKPPQTLRESLGILRRAKTVYGRKAR